MLTINNLQFEQQQEPLFKPIYLRVESRQCIQLCGSNGVGKTTVLKIIAGLLKPRRGSILWQNQKVPSCLRMSKYLGHELALKSSLSIHENLHYYAKLMQANKEAIKLACDFFDLTPFQDKWIQYLSAGQKHRCQLAKLMIGHCDLWLLDEPFTALDHHHIEQLLFLFTRHIAKGGSILFTSHHPIHSEQLNIQPFFLEPAS